LLDLSGFLILLQLADFSHRLEPLRSTHLDEHRADVRSDPRRTAASRKCKDTWRDTERLGYAWPGDRLRAPPADSAVRRRDQSPLRRVRGLGGDHAGCRTSPTTRAISTDAGSGGLRLSTPVCRWPSTTHRFGAASWMISNGAACADPCSTSAAHTGNFLAPCASARLDRLGRRSRRLRARRAARRLNATVTPSLERSAGRCDIDLVTLHHVLEHIHQPQAFLRTTVAAARRQASADRGAELFDSLGFAGRDQPLARSAGRKQHVYHYTKRSLRAARHLGRLPRSARPSTLWNPALEPALRAWSCSACSAGAAGARLRSPRAAGRRPQQRRSHRGVGRATTGVSAGAGASPPADDDHGSRVPSSGASRRIGRTRRASGDRGGKPMEASRMTVGDRQRARDAGGQAAAAGLRLRGARQCRASRRGRRRSALTCICWRC